MSWEVIRSSGKLVGEIGATNAVGAIARKALRKITKADRWEAVKVASKRLDHPVYIRVGTSDWTTFSEIFVNREYEEQSTPHAARIRSLYDSLISQGRTPLILDLGANTGLAAIWYATQFPKAHVIAVEPLTRNFDVMKRNVEPYSNVDAVQGAISDQKRTLILQNAYTEEDAWQTLESGDGEKVESFTVAELIGRSPDYALLIVKIDIEGHEKQLFQSNTEWVKQAPLIVVETHDFRRLGARTAHAVFSCLSQAGPRDYIQAGENMFCYSGEVE